MSPADEGGRLVARILILDHDVMLRNLLCDILEEESYSVVEAHNGYEGLWRGQATPASGGLSHVLYLVACSRRLYGA